MQECSGRKIDHRESLHISWSSPSYRGFLLEPFSLSKYLWKNVPTQTPFSQASVIYSLLKMKGQIKPWPLTHREKGWYWRITTRKYRQKRKQKRLLIPCGNQSHSPSIKILKLESLQGFYYEQGFLRWLHLFVQCLHARCLGEIMP